MILRNDEIARLIEELNLIGNHEPSCIQPASYDLRLDDEYYQDGKLYRLTETRHRVLTIAPYSLVFVGSFENVNIPPNVAARYDLRLGLVFKGLVLANATQVEPGSRGKLFALLFNLSCEPVHIRYKEHFATLEFRYTTSPTASSTVYDGERQDVIELRNAIPPYEVRCGLEDIFKKVEKSQRRIERMSDSVYVIFGIMFAVLAVLVAAQTILLVFK